MPLSSFLMYGSAQKNKAISWLAFSVLVIYLGSTNIANNWFFFAINFCIILTLSRVLCLVNNQLLKASSILIYSVIIDTVCFFMFPTSIGYFTYVHAGLLFNFKSALPVLLFATIVNVNAVLHQSCLCWNDNKQRKIKLKWLFNNSGD